MPSDTKSQVENPLENHTEGEGGPSAEGLQGEGHSAYAERRPQDYCMKKKVSPGKKGRESQRLNDTRQTEKLNDQM